MGMRRTYSLMSGLILSGATADLMWDRRVTVIEAHGDDNDSHVRDWRCAMDFLARIEARRLQEAAQNERDRQMIEAAAIRRARRNAKRAAHSNQEKDDDPTRADGSGACGE